MSYLNYDTIYSINSVNEEYLQCAQLLLDIFLIWESLLGLC